MSKKKSGLVFAYILKGRSGTPIDWEQINGWQPEQGILWVHLDYADEGAKQWLIDKSGLDKVSRSALLAEETRPRVVSSANSLLLILRGINFNPGADLEDMVAIRMWFDEHRIISMRHRRVKAMDDMNKSIQAGEGPESVGDFLAMAAGKLTDRMADVISDIDGSVDELEDSVLTEKSHELRQKLGELAQLQQSCVWVIGEVALREHAEAHELAVVALEVREVGARALTAGPRHPAAPTATRRSTAPDFGSFIAGLRGTDGIRFRAVPSYSIGSVRSTGVREPGRGCAAGRPSYWTKSARFLGRTL